MNLFFAFALAAIPVQTCHVVHTYPHDRAAFTEGLFYLNGFLYESTGLNGQSSLRKVDLRTGRVLQQYDISPDYFGEGIVAWKDRIYQLTWRNQTGFIFDLKTFRKLGEFHYPGEGWALARNDREIIMDDGTPEIRFWDPDTLRETHRITVTANGKPVSNLNEMEWVDGQILANIWGSDQVARIDPKTGHVVAWIDLRGLLKRGELEENIDAVLNGIAYDTTTKKLIFTGKHWPKLFEVDCK